MIRAVQKRWGELEKKRIKAISEEFSLSQPAAKKYIFMTEDEIDSLDTPPNYKKRQTVMDDYLNVIYGACYRWRRILLGRYVYLRGFRALAKRDLCRRANGINRRVISGVHNVSHRCVNSYGRQRSWRS